MHEVTRLLLYGFLAAASLVTLLTTLVVLASGRGRANGVAFAAAFVLGQTIAFLLALLVGSKFSEKPHTTATAYVELGAGAVLLAIAVRERLSREPLGAGGSPR